MLVSSKMYMFKECHYCGKKITKNIQRVNLNPKGSKAIWARFHKSCLEDMLKKGKAKELEG